MQVSVVIPLNPVPASRPRVSKWGTYYAKTYKEWRAAAEKLVPAAKTALTGKLGVDTFISVERPKTSKRAFPRGDIDNYEKAAWDLLTKKGYWEDDDQIVDTNSQKFFADEDYPPGVYVTIKQLDG